MIEEQKNIEVEHISKVYGSTMAIKDIHFSVAAGEIMGFLGANGAGKTTTMRILAGYLPATTGTARIAGYDVHRQSMQVRRYIGYLPEVPPLYPEMTVKQYLHFVAKIKGIRGRNRRRQVDRAMMRCQIIEQENILIRKLSKGYRQRVGIAQAIVHQPPVIILDEPTVGLDPRQIIEVRNLIRSLAGEHTIVLSTHILPEASTICDRVTIVNRGKVVTTNTPHNLQTNLTISSGYQLEVAGNPENIAAAIAALKNIPRIIEAIAVDNPQLNENDSQSIKIHCESDPRLGNEIAQLILNRGLKLYELRRTRPSLEDVFLELTTEELSPYSETE